LGTIYVEIMNIKLCSNIIDENDYANPKF